MKKTIRFFLLITLAAAITIGCSFFFELANSINGVPNSVEAPASEAIQATTESQATLAPSLAGSDIDLDELFAPVWESREHLQNYFVQQPIEDQVLAQGALGGLVSLLEDQGIQLDELEVGDAAPSAASLAVQAGTPAESRQAFADFWAAWRAVQYGDGQLEKTAQDYVHAALAGLVTALDDPHTAYMNPDQVQQSNIQLEGEYEGIGAFVDTTTEFVTIVSPIEGSPAEAAGLKPGDLVIAVDGEDMTGVPGTAVIGRILGPAGSSVLLTIQREDEPEPFDVEIVREQISVPSVSGEMLEDNIAYVQLFTFGANSSQELNEILEELLAQDPKGLILDLRNNGGGFLNTAVSITSEFITGNRIVLFEEYGDGSRDEYQAFSDGIATQITLIVLVNEGTASASEILAGAIQDYDRGLLVGQTTFGKGSVQQPVALSGGQGALRITVAHWLTPDERLIHGVGLTPDVEVMLSEEDSEAERDPQLDRAIELINENS
ncbi:MAG: S41 family peptidase [Anaerolineales bacterium]